MRIAIYCIILMLAFIGYVRYLEGNSVFYPSRELAATPLEIGLPFEDLTIESLDGVRINGWLVKAPSARSTLLFFHGNAGNIGDRLGKIALFHKLGINVLIIDYRGYGKSEGRPTEQGVYSDAIAAYDYAVGRADLEGQKIISYGASLGGAVAVDLALKRPVDCLIADSTFSSAADMAKRLYPHIPAFFIRTKLDSLSKIQQVHVPKLFIHSVDDELVPFALGNKLFEAAPDPKEMIKIIGSHNDGHLYDEERIESGIRTFLKGLGYI